MTLVSPKGMAILMVVLDVATDLMPLVTRFFSHLDGFLQ